MSIETSDADLKAAQLPIMDITGDGTITNISDFAKTVNVGANVALQPGCETILNDASSILGTVFEVIGVDDIPNKSVWVSSSSGINVFGQNGGIGGVSGDSPSGSNGSLVETANFTAGTTVQGGDGSPNSFDENIVGGNASLTLIPSKASWIGVLQYGADGFGAGVNSGGVPNLILVSILATVALNLTLSGGSSSNSTPGISVVVSGSALQHLTLVLSAGGFINGTNGPSLDFSGCILDDASLDNIVQACLNCGYNNFGEATPFLNIGGTCATASAGTQTDIATLQDLGWNVTYNS